MTDPELVAKKLDLGIVRDVVENHLDDLLGSTPIAGARMEPGAPHGSRG